MKLVCGVGINDADYVVQPRVDGIRSICPIYKRWKSMIDRCYSESCLRRRPTYRGCSVIKEWLTFSKFSKWMVQQDWEGKCLDKDLLIEGNKEYGPTTCIFAEPKINTIILDCQASRGLHPLGVYKRGDKYRPQVRRKGKNVNLGSFITPEEAHRVWRKAKAEILEDARELTTDIRIKEALTKRSWELLCS